MKVNEKLRRSAFRNAFTPFFMEFCDDKISRVKLNLELRRIMRNLNMWDDPLYLEHRLAIEKVLRDAKDDGAAEGEVQLLLRKEQKGGDKREAEPNCGHRPRSSPD